MHDEQPIIATIYEGWHTYQSKLTTALAPLTDVQLGLRVAPTYAPSKRSSRT